MSMVLTPLEADLLGDMAQDYHAAWEIFAFVRHYHGGDPATVRRVGRDLLATWDARGWLAVVDEPPDWPGVVATSIAELLELIDRAESLGVEFAGAGTWLRLTGEAHRDVEWLGPAS
jgi:hypothetical protein